MRTVQFGNKEYDLPDHLTPSEEEELNALLGIKNKLQLMKKRNKFTN